MGQCSVIPLRSAVHLVHDLSTKGLSGRGGVQMSTPHAFVLPGERNGRPSHLSRPRLGHVLCEEEEVSAKESSCV